MKLRKLRNKKHLLDLAVFLIRKYFLNSMLIKEQSIMVFMNTNWRPYGMFKRVFETFSNSTFNRRWILNRDLTVHFQKLHKILPLRLDLHWRNADSHLHLPMGIYPRSCSCPGSCSTSPSTQETNESSTGNKASAEPAQTFASKWKVTHKQHLIAPLRIDLNWQGMTPEIKRIKVINAIFWNHF